MSANKPVSLNAELSYQKAPDGSIVVFLKGILNSDTITYFYKELTNLLKIEIPRKLTFNCKDITYCDTIGVSLFIKAAELARQNNYGYEITNLDKKYTQLLNLFHPDTQEAVGEVTIKETFIERLGEDSLNLLGDIKESITFIGQATIALLQSLLNPRKVRWKDVLVTSEKVGVNAFGIIALVNFLVGLVISFQSAIPLEKYGGTIFVADLLVLSTFRELGPLMTAIVVNGRSGSAFAAEIGTMKVNEEVDALTTMGLDPIKFLVVPKIIASLIMIPILTVFGNLFALIGGLVVMITLGFPPVAYLNEIVSAASYVDFLGGLFKSVFFAVIIAGVGCLEGLKTQKGPAAVGDSTTSAVVRGIILIILFDGIFGVLFYYLGI